jgi:hypothetical protein
MDYDELFHQVGEVDWRCTVCGRDTVAHPDLMESDIYESYGGTYEGYDRCTGCGTTRSWIDLSAVR